ncbi:MAG: Hpt domain-containing protein, partial [Deltaproteobacteria bacterium]|nr:Hpt domain-containing protein [Deltaproteobacteria bacterium]
REQELVDALTDVASSPITPPEVTQELPVLDPSILIDMVGDDVETLHEVIATYKDTLPPLLVQLEQDLASGDLESAAGAAHSIKGGAANLGGGRLRHIAAGIESAARNEDGDACIPLLADASRELDRLIRALAKQDWKKT